MKIEQLSPKNINPETQDDDREALLELKIKAGLGETALDNTCYDGPDLFHGTSFPFKIGDVIRPGGVFPVTDPNGVAQASATRSENAAWLYAQRGDLVEPSGKYDERGDPLLLLRNDHDGIPRPVPLRERVFRVVPVDCKPPKHLGPQPGEMNSSAFKVVEEISTKLGYQGTFPEINWSKYTPFEDRNHPAPIFEDPPLPDVPKPPQATYDVPFPILGEDFAQSELTRVREADEKERGPVF